VNFTLLIGVDFFE